MYLIKNCKWGGGVGIGPIFNISFIFFDKNLSLKDLIFLKKHFKTNLFYSMFGGEEPPQPESGPDGRLELLSLLRKTCGTCQMTQTIQKSFHSMFSSSLLGVGGSGRTLIDFFFRLTPCLCVIWGQNWTSTKFVHRCVRLNKV